MPRVTAHAAAVEILEPRYATTSEGRIAYQVVGDGKMDLVLVPNWLTNLDVMWEDSHLERFLRRLASFSRLILLDKRGSGLSDPIPIGMAPNFEDSMMDIRSVLDAVGSERASIVGIEQGSFPSLFFAATFPARVSALVLVDCYARLVREVDYPGGMPAATYERFMRANVERFGTGRDLEFIAPELYRDERFRRWYARLERLSITPGAYETFNLGTISWPWDGRSLLPTISAPTLVISHAEHAWVRPEHGRYIAEHIPGARYVERPGFSGLWWRHDVDGVLDEIQAFLTGTRGAPGSDDRVLTTILFTDIVGSTERAAELGDARWRALLDSHDAVVRRQIERLRGEVIKTTGDGFLATFDGPARAVRCAVAVQDELRSLGVQVRSGVHTGEVERRGEDVGGIAVHIAQRVQGLAEPDGILVSRTVVDLVAGSGIEFDDRGAQELRGVPGEWRLFAVKT
jgi:class 3 adenylate cyclase